MEKETSKRHDNRAVRKAVIVDSAEKLFLRHGFEHTSMNDVSQEAGLTKRTIYRYFPSKEDLFFAVVLKGTLKLDSMCAEALSRGRNALERIGLTNMAYSRFYLENADMFRLMNYQPENRSNCEASPHYREIAAVKDRTIADYMRIIEAGKSDGSIRADLDTKQTVYFGFCTAVGLLNMVSMMERSFFWERDGIDPEAFLRFGMELLTDALK